MKRVVVAGFGDTGLLVAIHLGPGFDVVGVGTKPCLVSGQELGTRLTRPDEWRQNYLMRFDQYPRLDHARFVHGRIDGVDPVSRHIDVTTVRGQTVRHPYDALVIASGVTNGFWRTATLEDAATIEAGIEDRAAELAAARRVAIVGGGATSVSVAANLRERAPDTEVHLFFPGDQPLPHYHPRVRRQIVRRLQRSHVQLHPGHRAALPADRTRLTRAPIQFTTGQSAFVADRVLWATGQGRPNTGFVPPDMLDEGGFVLVDEHLRVPGHPDVFAVGDVAASDPHRSSARNWGYLTVAHNLRVTLTGRGRLRRYRAPQNRWGSVLGVQKDGLRVFQPGGGSFRFPPWAVRSVLWPVAVDRFIYRGVRRS